MPIIMILKMKIFSNVIVFASKVISIARVATVDANATIAPNAGDDLTFVKYQDVKVNDNIDLTISSGDFVVDVYDLAI